MKVSPSYSPWTSRPEFLAKGLNVTPRVKDLIDIIVIQEMKAKDLPASEIGESLTEMFLDVSQSLSRNAHTQKGTNKCLTTATQNYSFKQDRVVLGLESLVFQGYPRGELKVPNHFSNQHLKELAGEGMCLPCLATVMWSLFVHVLAARCAFN